MDNAEDNVLKSRGWRKNLYSNFGYEDNYTDITFLQNLRTNVNQKHVSLNEAVLGAGRVTEQLSLVFDFIAIYQFLFKNICFIEHIFIYSSVATCLCYLYYLIVIQHELYDLIFIHGKTLVIFLILGFVLSPVLKTLTETISTDTINATTFVMMFVHLIFFDYNVPVAISSRALSLNAAIFGSLCLASRLSSSFHAFVLLTVSAECFVLYPPFANAVRAQLTMFFLLFHVGLSALLLSYASQPTCVFFILLVLFLNGICPLLYVYWQKYKNNIYGPWDEAVIPKTYLNKTE